MNGGGDEWERKAGELTRGKTERDLANDDTMTMRGLSVCKGNE